MTRITDVAAPLVVLAIVGCGAARTTDAPIATASPVDVPSTQSGRMRRPSAEDASYGPRKLSVIAAEPGWTPDQPIMIARIAADVLDGFPAVDRSGKVIAILRSDGPNLTHYNPVQKLRIVSLGSHATIATFELFDEDRDLYSETPEDWAVREDTKAKLRVEAQALLDRTTWRTLERRDPSDDTAVEGPWASLDEERLDDRRQHVFVRFLAAGLDLELVRDASGEAATPDEFIVRRPNPLGLRTTHFAADLPRYGIRSDGTPCGTARGIEDAWVTPDATHVLLEYSWDVEESECVAGLPIDALAVVDIPR